MESVFNKKVILETSSHALESFVNKTYGGDLSVSLIEEGDGDGTVSEDIVKEDVHSYKHKEELSKEIASGNYSNVSGIYEVLLTLLHDGHIEEGSYIIHEV